MANKVSHYLILLFAISIILITLLTIFNLLSNFSFLTIIPSSWFKANTSTVICFLLAGIILLFIAKKNRSYPRDIILFSLSILILIISSANLIEYLTGFDFVIYQFDIASAKQIPQMAFTSAIAFILAGVAFILILKKSQSIWLIQTLAFFILIVTLLSVLNDAYGADPAAAFTQYTTMSMQTMFLFLLVSISILLTHIDSGIIGSMFGKNKMGYLIYWIMPILIIVPIIFIENARIIDSVSTQVITHTALFALAGMIVALITVVLNRKEMELEQVQRDMLQNELIFHQFADNIEIVFYTTSADLKNILYVSPAYERIWGKTSESLYENPRDWFDAILPEDRGKAYDAFFVGMQQGKEKASAEFRIKRPDGTIRNIFSRVYQVKDEANHVFAVVGIAIDLTEITLEKRYKQIQYDFLNLVEHEENINEFFHKALKLLGSSLHVKFSGLWLIVENSLHCVDTWYEKSNFLDEFNISSFKNTFLFGEGFPGEVWKTKKPYFIPNFSDVPAYPRSRCAKEAGLNSSFGIPIIHQNKIFGIMEFFSEDIRKPDPGLVTLMDDISKSIGKFIVHANTLAQIETISRHDLLTGLNNRAAFEEVLNRLITEEKTNSIAVIVLDIDRFKLINAALGHDFGDKLLKSVAARLIESTMDVDKISLGRLGTDQFILCLPEISRQKTYEYVEMIRHKFNDSFHVGEGVIHATLSIGIAVYPKDGLDSKSLAINANLAMAQAKDQGGNRINFYSKDLPFFTSEAINMIDDIREAIKSKNQFILEYQPQIDLKTGDICAAEVLVRWQHPVKGLLYPGTFIPFSEKNNLIVSLNEHILHKAFQQMSENEIEIPISINISAQQFKDGFHLVEFLESLMKKFSINTTQIELEITENMLLEDSEHNIAVLTAIRELGFQIAIDDFGTGFSSFNYLRRLPIQKIKIDRSFIIGIPEDLDNVKIVKAMIALSHSFDKIIVAEGAETKEEVDYLKQVNCDIVQGFYYYKPMSFIDLKAVLDRKVAE